MKTELCTFLVLTLHNISYRNRGFSHVIIRRIVFALAAAACVCACGVSEAQGMFDQIPSAEYNALVDLYQSTGGDRWGQKDGWLHPEAGSWVRVQVSRGHVTELDLVDNNLVGILPASLGNLQFLEYMDFASNPGLQGSLPANLGSLTNLSYINFNLCNLSGAIPTTFGYLTNLAYLHLGEMQLTGGIPESFGNLTAMRELYLYRNPLSGRIPDALGNLSRLQYLRLDFTYIYGEIPSSLRNLFSLKQLWLSNNFLSGDVPSFGASSPFYLDVADNYLNISDGSESLSNINAMIANGSTVLYRNQIPLPTVKVGPIDRSADGPVAIGVNGLIGTTYTIEGTDDFQKWVSEGSITLTNVTLDPRNASGVFLDTSALNVAYRFYRAARK